MALLDAGWPIQAKSVRADPLYHAPWDDVAQTVDGVLSLRRLEAPGVALVSARVRGAVHLGPLAFQRRVAQAYERLGRELASCTASAPVRLWNYVPGIVEPLGELQHRYMVFNAGRYTAYTRWYQNRDRFERYVATASGVGHRGEDYWLHCLGLAEPGQPVENPRQISSYRYSMRYGPRPPCFARATRCRLPGSAESTLLVGGTASVLGEDSLHWGDLRAQTLETFRNLAAVAATEEERASFSGEADEDALQAVLSRYRELRVYYVHAEARDTLESMVGRRFDGVAAVEWVVADLCRPELLVEIEGVV